GAIHPLNLDLALQDFNVVLGMYMSALNHSVVSLPVEPEPDLIEKLRLALTWGTCRIASSQGVA
ncbi:MAG: hypothetical protein MUQ30_01770, partial [Anaerolineae bacterium]|nr:hypothetical protein [Anaerolineae bacterium]